jgi:hypothetical protein
MMAALIGNISWHPGRLKSMEGEGNTRQYRNSEIQNPGSPHAAHPRESLNPGRELFTGAH